VCGRVGCCDFDFQGYLNGTVETGERVANEITSALR
jgi:hypothetical protein